MPLRPLGTSLRLLTLVFLVVPTLVYANLISVDLRGNTDRDLSLQDIADMVGLGVDVDDGGVSLTLDLPSDDAGPPEPAASKVVVRTTTYSCPPKDKHGNTLGFHSQSSSPMRCMYKSQDRDRGSYCLYDKRSGTLTADHHDDLCPEIASEDSSSKRRRSPLPVSPRKPSATRAPVSAAMKTRRKLGIRKHRGRG